MCDKILITGDFNMKDIDWHSYSTIHSDEHTVHQTSNYHSPLVTVEVT